MREVDRPIPSAAPCEVSEGADSKLPLERLDHERLRAWRSDCRHHEDDREIDESE